MPWARRGLAHGGEDDGDELWLPDQPKASAATGASKGDGGSLSASPASPTGVVTSRGGSAVSPPPSPSAAAPKPRDLRQGSLDSHLGRRWPDGEPYRGGGRGTPDVRFGSPPARLVERPHTDEDKASAENSREERFEKCMHAAMVIPDL